MNVVVTLLAAPTQPCCRSAAPAHSETAPPLGDETTTVEASS